MNAEKVAVSGKKRTQKLYRRHSGRPGGMKVETFDQLQQRIPERIIEHAVRGMLPKGRVSFNCITWKSICRFDLLQELKFDSDVGGQKHTHTQKNRNLITVLGVQKP